MINNDRFLFETTTFTSGFGAIIDLGGTMVMFNESSSPEEADYLAPANDGAVVGKDTQCNNKP